MWNIKGERRPLVLGTWEDNAGGLCQCRFSPKCSPWLAAFSEKASSVLCTTLARSRVIRVFVAEGFLCSLLHVRQLHDHETLMHAFTLAEEQKTRHVRPTVYDATCRDSERILESLARGRIILVSRMEKRDILLDGMWKAGTFFRYNFCQNILFQLLGPSLTLSATFLFSFSFFLFFYHFIKLGTLGLNDEMLEFLEFLSFNFPMFQCSSTFNKVARKNCTSSKRKILIFKMMVDLIKKRIFWFLHALEFLQLSRKNSQFFTRKVIFTTVKLEVSMF